MICEIGYTETDFMDTADDMKTAIEAVQSVLGEIGADTVPQIHVLNKCDLAHLPPGIEPPPPATHQTPPVFHQTSADFSSDFH